MSEEIPVFVYFECQEGGMEAFPVRGEDDLRRGLFSWRKGRNEVRDVELLQWMVGARVGDMASHRLGYLVRVRPDTLWSLS